MKLPRYGLIDVKFLCDLSFASLIEKGTNFFFTDIDVLPSHNSLKISFSKRRGKTKISPSVKIKKSR